VSSDTGVKQVDAYPYRHGGECLGFEIVGYDLDDGTSESLGDTVEVDLSEGSDWQTGTLAVRMTVQKQTLKRVFPSPPPSNGALIVVGVLSAEPLSIQ